MAAAQVEILRDDMSRNHNFENNFTIALSNNKEHAITYYLKKSTSSDGIRKGPKRTQEQVQVSLDLDYGLLYANHSMVSAFNFQIGAGK